MEPEAPQFLLARGRLYAGLSRWDKADADFAKALAAQPDDSDLWYYRASGLLLAGDTAGYRQVRGRALERFGQTEGPRTAFCVARLCTLAPKAIADPARAVRLAQQAVEAAKVPWTLHVLGIAHYRCGQLQEAVRWLHESMQLDTDWTGDVQNWLVLALAHHDQGQHEAARQWLGNAVHRMDENIQKSKREGGPVLWGIHPHDW